MAYIVNAEIPKHCNKCPFGMLKFSKPLSDRTHGYTCNLEVPKEGHNKTTMITDYDADIEKPDWCLLRPVSEKDETYTRNKAIDDFVCYMCNEFDSEYADVEEHSGEYVVKRVHSIAEHLKGGGIDG